MNPFEAFRSYSATRRELPLDRILARRDQVLQRLSQSYQALIEEESKQLIWVVEQGALSRAYSTAIEALRGVDFTVEDLEDMCLELDTNDGVTTPMGAPSGLFIAAMCNQVSAHDIALNLHIFRHRLPASPVCCIASSAMAGRWVADLRWIIRRIGIGLLCKSDGIV